MVFFFVFKKGDIEVFLLFFKFVVVNIVFIFRLFKNDLLEVYRFCFNIGN